MPWYEHDTGRAQHIHLGLTQLTIEAQAATISLYDYNHKPCTLPPLGPWNRGLHDVQHSNFMNSRLASVTIKTSSMYVFDTCILTAVSRSPFCAIFTLLSASLVHPLWAIILLPSVYFISFELAPFIRFLDSSLILSILPLTNRRPYLNS